MREKGRRRRSGVLRLRESSGVFSSDVVGCNTAPIPRFRLSLCGATATVCPSYDRVSTNLMHHEIHKWSIDSGIVVHGDYMFDLFVFLHRFIHLVLPRRSLHNIVQ